MNHKILKLSLLFLLGLGLTEINAQVAVAAAGGNAAGSGGVAGYTVGQVAYTAYTSTAGSVAQGVQQAFDFSTLGIENNLINLALIAFPNPTTNTLTLKVKDYSLDNMYYQLYDLQGRLLIQNKLTHLTTNIPTEYLAPAVYFMKVIKENKLLKTFKIIKTQ